MRGTLGQLIIRIEVGTRARHLYGVARRALVAARGIWGGGIDQQHPQGGRNYQALGTVMSFMMATVALSLPEFILLKQVLKPKLLAIFFSSVAAAILTIGLGFNIFS